MQSAMAFVLEFLHAFIHRSAFTLPSQATRKGLIPTGSIDYCMPSSGFVFHASFFKYFHVSFCCSSRVGIVLEELLQTSKLQPSAIPNRCPSYGRCSGKQEALCNVVVIGRFDDYFANVTSVFVS